MEGLPERRGSFVVNGEPKWLNCCAGCVFANEVRRDFECRRMPPFRTDYFWPKVLPTDWCGEFSQKDSQ